MGSVSLPFLSPTRAVIMMMDDGVCVYRVSAKDVSFVGGVIWRNAEFETRLAEMIRRTGASSVLVLNDAVEQHYRKEKVTIPTSFDKANIIKRRLSVAFPNYPMRAAIELKEATAISRAQGGKEEAKSTVYLFAAAPSTESFSRIIRAVGETDCNIFGYSLLPIESSGMVKIISQKLAQRWGGASGAAWSILVGQHRGGGLRQIVVRGNELALTRVTPVDEPKEGLGDVWAADVSQELQATLSYLSRFGYVPEDGLNIIVMGDKKNAELLESLIAVPCNFEALAPSEVASVLGIRISKEDGDHYSDCIHAAWAGKKVSLSLALSSKEISSIAGPRQTATAIMLALSLGFGGVLYLASTEAQGLYENTTNLEVAKVQQIEIERLYQEEVKRKEAMGIDVNLIKGALEIDSRVRKQHIDLLGILKDVSLDLGNIRMDGLEYTGDSLSLAAVPEGQPPVPRKGTLKLKFSFAGNINPSDGNKEMTDLAGRLNTRLTPLGYKSRVSQPLQNLTYTGEVDREVGLTANKRASSERYSAEIEIQKVNDAQSSGN